MIGEVEVGYKSAIRGFANTWAGSVSVTLQLGWLPQRCGQVLQSVQIGEVIHAVRCFTRRLSGLYIYPLGQVAHDATKQVMMDSVYESVILGLAKSWPARFYKALGLHKRSRRFGG